MNTVGPEIPLVSKPCLQYIRAYERGSTKNATFTGQSAREKRAPCPKRGMAQACLSVFELKVEAALIRGSLTCATV